MGKELHTDRLVLRRFQEKDREPFAAMNADPFVMRYFPATLTHSQSDDTLLRIANKWDETGISYWAVTLKSTGELIGTVGINFTDYQVMGEYVYEIGWRIASAFHRQGYATEAASEVLRVGFEVSQLQRVVSFTVLENTPSQAVMKKLGMRDTQFQFFHPSIAASHPLSEHCLYEITSQMWYKLHHPPDEVNE
ncbi:GNAT family N-acetyltransferase [Enterovibrio norvegicus]|uniref:GNAT family N-acetyltransferase n=1 Tax=Enterovibrio norvegicus TaxID=188144 RepID=UPI0024B27BD0|nr:GNAT family N-acetyltransferase [Enterovibrio norvegicus]